MSFEKLVANSFIRDTVGLCSYDTMLTSPLVISYYVTGLTNFVHFNPNRGYFKTQLGTTYLIFQSRRPGQGKLLEEAWKKVATDTLINYDFKNTEFTLTEIIYEHHDRLVKKMGNHLIPMLSSYSVDTYRKWGFGDSTEVSMRQFIGEDSLLSHRQFSKITSISLSITKKELTDLTSMMKVTGYELNKNKFTMPGQPDILFTVNEKIPRYKVDEVILLLKANVPSKTIELGEVKLTAKDNKATFKFR